eukprot:Pgem_evm1s2623
MCHLNRATQTIKPSWLGSNHSPNRFISHSSQLDSRLSLIKIETVQLDSRFSSIENETSSARFQFVSSNWK